MYQQQEEWLDKAYDLNLKSMTLYGVIGTHNSELPQNVIDSLLKQAEGYQEEAERLEAKVHNSLSNKKKPSSTLE
jgi:hypothetical protein